MASENNTIARTKSESTLYDYYYELDPENGIECLLIPEHEMIDTIYEPYTSD